MQRIKAYWQRLPKWLRVVVSVVTFPIWGLVVLCKELATGNNFTH